MIQFYLLSVVCNALAGYALTRNDDPEQMEPLPSFALSARNPTFRLLLGFMTSLIGLFKLLSSIDPPIVGDLIPALTGIAGGLLLAYDYYAKTTTLKPESKLSSLLAAKHTKKGFGVWACVSSALHFLFPQMLLF